MAAGKEINPSWITEYNELVMAEKRYNEPLTSARAQNYETPNTDLYE